MGNRFKTYLDQEVEAAPLAVFRIFFGLMMLLSIIRFWAYGWIEKLYLEPGFHFSYYGFEWVKPLGGFTYVIFALCVLSTIGIALGFRYRWSVFIFFLSFTYIELMDKTTYLNHYYFISILAFLLLFLPAGGYFSVDAIRNPKKAFQRVPRWTIDALKLLLCIVYFYAGLAKLNSDWILDAMPLKIWLPSKFDIPVIGGLLGKEWVHYAFSWGGALYDLAIPFLLWFKPTRWLAFVLVVVFHVLTRVLFPIGMFPYIMIVSALIFFDAGFHHKILRAISTVLGISKKRFEVEVRWRSNTVNRGIVMAFFLIQLLLPWRYLAYPGELFWTEEGYRFSWRVMLMEKSGYAQFKIVDKTSGRWFYVDNSDFLTAFQEKQMAFQPDFILEYAHYLHRHFTESGHGDLAIFVESYVSLNGRLGTTFIDPEVDLMTQKESFYPKTWIRPFEDEIIGL